MSSIDCPSTDFAVEFCRYHDCHVVKNLIHWRGRTCNALAYLFWHIYITFRQLEYYWGSTCPISNLSCVASYEWTSERKTVNYRQANVEIKTRYHSGSWTVFVKKHYTLINRIHCTVLVFWLHFRDIFRLSCSFYRYSVSKRTGSIGEMFDVGILCEVQIYELVICMFRCFS